MKILKVVYLYEYAGWFMSVLVLTFEELVKNYFLILRLPLYNISIDKV